MCDFRCAGELEQCQNVDSACAERVACVKKSDASKCYETVKWAQLSKQEMAMFTCLAEQKPALRSGEFSGP